jgi:hypothetical protein
MNGNGRHAAVVQVPVTEVPAHFVKVLSHFDQADWPKAHIVLAHHYETQRLVGAAIALDISKTKLTRALEHASPEEYMKVGQAMADLRDAISRLSQAVNVLQEVTGVAPWEERVGQKAKPGGGPKPKPVKERPASDEGPRKDPTPQKEKETSAPALQDPRPDGTQDRPN